MKPFLASILAIVVISIGANYALTQLDWSSAETFSTSNVRLD
ncbi:MAG: hypothetical protein AAGM38_08225 [Pseudomonadota bacterium]